MQDLAPNLAEVKMSSLNTQYALLLEINKLKLVFRNTAISPLRKESTAEHSWSVSMIILILMQELKKEFTELDELKAIKLALIHDIVEIYAGDVLVFDVTARKDKEQDELRALQELMSICPEFGKELRDLWFEFETKSSIEAKIAKAADAICPIFLRLQMRQSYSPIHITLEQLDSTKCPYFAFSKTFSTLYQQLKTDLLKEHLIDNP